MIYDLNSAIKDNYQIVQIFDGSDDNHLGYVNEKEEVQSLVNIDSATGELKTYPLSLHKEYQSSPLWCSGVNFKKCVKPNEICKAWIDWTKRASSEPDITIEAVQLIPIILTWVKEGQNSWIVTEESTNTVLADSTY